MIYTQEDNYKIYQIQKKDIKSLSVFKHGFETDKYHLIFDFSLMRKIPEDLMQFALVLSNIIRPERSFIIIIPDSDADDYSEELVVVPTLEEAIDVIELEAIERELGF
jgi:hypothetical protein